MRRQIVCVASILAMLAVPVAAQAQGIVGGAESGAAQGNRAAGPVGGIVGGVVGGAVGGAVGGVRGVLGVPRRAYPPRTHRQRVYRSRKVIVR